MKTIFYQNLRFLTKEDQQIQEEQLMKEAFQNSTCLLDKLDRQKKKSLNKLTSN